MVFAAASSWGCTGLLVWYVVREDRWSVEGARFSVGFLSGVLKWGEKFASICQRGGFTKHLMQGRGLGLGLLCTIQDLNARTSVWAAWPVSPSGSYTVVILMGSCSTQGRDDPGRVQYVPVGISWSQFLKLICEQIRVYKPQEQPVCSSSTLWGSFKPAEIQ